MPGVDCVIVISGELSERFDGVFGGLALHAEAGRTQMSGRVLDQSELQGVLRQLFDLGLEVLAVSTSPPPDELESGSPG